MSAMLRRRMTPAVEVIRILKRIPPTPGKDLRLTLDSHLQQTAEAAFAGHRGALVAIEPATGEILAMISQPGFDRKILLPVLTLKIIKPPVSGWRPLYDRALRGLYSPGSTIKPFIALEGLDAGAVTPEDTIFDPGWFKLEGSEHVFHDWQHSWSWYSQSDTRHHNVLWYLFFYALTTAWNCPYWCHSECFWIGQKTGVDLRVREQVWLLHPPINDRSNMLRGIEAILWSQRLVRAICNLRPCNLLPPLPHSQCGACANHLTSWKILRQGHLLIQWFFQVKAFGMSWSKQCRKSSRRPRVMVPYTLANRIIPQRSRREPPKFIQFVAKALMQQQKTKQTAERLRDNSLFIGFAPVENHKLPLQWSQKMIRLQAQLHAVWWMLG